MPNHVRNRLFLEGNKKEIEKLKSTLAFDGKVDFNTVIKMPQSLEIEAGSITGDAVDVYLTSINPDVTYYGNKKSDEKTFKEILEKVRNYRGYKNANPFLTKDELEKSFESYKEERLLHIGESAVINIMVYDSDTWYDWSIKNWGTKWNAYDSEIMGNGEIAFSTAWSAPHPVIEELSKKFSNIVITHKWADEDIGVNCGISKYKNGQIIEKLFPANEVEAVDLAALVWGDDVEMDYGLYLNATGTNYIPGEDVNFDVVSMFGKNVLFTKSKLTLLDIIKGLHVYYIKPSLDGNNKYYILSENMKGNITGSVVTLEKINMDGDIILNLEDAPIFQDKKASLADCLFDIINLEDTLELR